MPSPGVQRQKGFRVPPMSPLQELATRHVLDEDKKREAIRLPFFGLANQINAR
jgi:hypothetical protein